ncbi:MAG: sigma-70 family RNA polymerase sigma factor [Proteobacteria bacterium]|nr:sigma-70 family RNA polymerase sigma factor [Pseudomonadota bacterium]
MAADADADADGDDAALVARCRRGDGAAWSLLVRRYQRLVYAIVMRAGLDEHHAADVFQTVFSRLLQHLPRIADPSRLQAWIVTCAKREAIALVRKARRTVSLTPEDDDAAEPDIVDDALIPEELLATLQDAHGLRLALERLDVRCRALIELSFGDDDLPYDEIGRRMAMPVGSIGPTRGRCLDKLRKLMT